MTFVWKNIPLSVARPLLQGSVGTTHLLHIGNEALLFAQNSSREEARQLLEIAAQTFLSAWEWDILNPHAVEHVLRLHKIFPLLNAQSLALAHSISQMQYPANIMKLQYVLLQEGKQAALHFLENMKKQEPKQLFWLWRAVALGMAEGEFAWLEKWLIKDTLLPKPIQLALLGDIALARRDSVKAGSCYIAALRDFPSLLWRERLGEAALYNNSLDMALAQWDIVLQKRPWHTNLLLRRYDVLKGRHKGANLPSGRGAVLLYTWNKASYLEESLQSLAESSLKNSLIVVLNNGSTDQTNAVLKIWEHRLGDSLLRVDMPCNIGAPAARNWLLTLPETRACDWLAFADDDATVPPNWLSLLGSAMEAYPESPVYGCRVVDKDTPLCVQSADLHLREGGEKGCMQGGEYGKEPGHKQRFSIANIHSHCLDFGSFSYMRPCTSVTGCCHLLRREALDAIGHFDVRFSPSQYDDLEHDIRYALQGKWPVYQGHLCVKHARKSGNEAAKQHSAMMSGWSNLFKLQTKYTQEQYDFIREQEHAVLLADILSKIAMKA